MVVVILSFCGLPVMKSSIVAFWVRTLPAASNVPSLTITAVLMLSCQVPMYFFF